MGNNSCYYLNQLAYAEVTGADGEQSCSIKCAAAKKRHIGEFSSFFLAHSDTHTLTRAHTMHALPAGSVPKPHLAFLNHEGKALVEAEQNEMKINMAEQRLRPRTRYQSPW